VLGGGCAATESFPLEVALVNPKEEWVVPVLRRIRPLSLSLGASKEFMEGSGLGSYEGVFVLRSKS
jgi:hypothetical protein